MPKPNEKVIVITEAGATIEPLVSADIPLALLITRRPRKVYSGMWGTPEIAAVAVSAVALLAAILLYTLVVIPSNRELVKNRSEADRLEAERLSANTKYGEITDTQTQVAKLLASADDFETRFLPAATNGRSSLYQRINGLIAAYGLTNTTGPDYVPLEMAEQNPASPTDEERGRAKFKSLFPGTYVTMTVEGSYQNLRRFIREIETGNEFVIISSVELAPSDSEQKKPETGAPKLQNQQAGIPNDQSLAEFRNPTKVNPSLVQAQTRPAATKGKTHGETVALRLEMAAYFRRLNYVRMTSGTQ